MNYLSFKPLSRDFQLWVYLAQILGLLLKDDYLLLTSLNSHACGLCHVCMHWLLVSPSEINNVYFILVANIERMVEQLHSHLPVVSCCQCESMRSAALVCARGDDIWARLSNQASNDSTKPGQHAKSAIEQIFLKSFYWRGSLPWG